MINKLKKISVYMFFVVFTICFSFTLVNVLIHNNEYHYKTWTLFFYILCFLYIVFFIYGQLSKHESFLSKHYKKILITFLLIMGVLQITFSTFLRFEPTFDIRSVIQGATDWVQTGTFENFYDYYYSLPVNLGSMSFVYVFFKFASFFGVKDFIFVAIILNSLLSLSSIATVFFTSKRLLGVKYGVLSLVLIAFSLPFYFIAPVIYTDSLSMLFPILFYYLYLRWKDESNTKNLWILCSLMGIVAFIGMLIKFTVVIMVIAVLIDMFININWKKMFIYGGAICIIIFICFTLFDGYIYSFHLDKEQAKFQNDPNTHWVMMGLKGSGGYNPQDFDYTRSFHGPDAKRKANIEEIKRRIVEYGPDGMFHLFIRKSVRCFGNGTYALADYLQDRRTDRSILHKYVVFDGEKYNLYRHVCEAVLFAIMVFMVLSAIQYILGKVNGSNKNITLAPTLSVFGLFLFLLMWETTGRYITNFIPVIILCGTLGFNFFHSLSNEFIASIKEGFKKVT